MLRSTIEKNRKEAEEKKKKEREENPIGTFFEDEYEFAEKEL
jgi:hypothetical protein